MYPFIQITLEKEQVKLLTYDVKVVVPAGLAITIAYLGKTPRLTALTNVAELSSVGATGNTGKNTGTY